MLMAAIFDAILNYSNSSRVPKWHPVDFQGRPLRDSKYVQNNYAPRFAHFGQKSAFGTWTNTVNLSVSLHALLDFQLSMILREFRCLSYRKQCEKNSTM